MFRKLILSAFIVCAHVVTYAQTSVKENLDPKDFQQKMKTSSDVVLLDVRTPQEVEQGFIKGAVNMDIRSSEFKTQLSKLDKSKSYFLYCAAGVRSNKAVEMMESLGFEKMYNLTGGIEAWKEKGLPLEKK